MANISQVVDNSLFLEHAKKITRARNDSDLADKLGVVKSHVSQWRRGILRPTLRVLAKIKERTGEDLTAFVDLSLNHPARPSHPQEPRPEYHPPEPEKEEGMRLARLCAIAHRLLKEGDWDTEVAIVHASKKTARDLIEKWPEGAEEEIKQVRKLLNEALAKIRQGRRP